MKKLLSLLLVIMFVGVSLATNIDAYKGKLDMKKGATITGDTMTVCAKFTQEFINKYKYEDSTNYRFALNVKVNGVGGRYDVMRNKNNGVSNLKNKLNGAISAKDFVKGYCRTIPMNTKLNFATDSYVAGRQYTKKVLKPGFVKAYLSATKELKGRELADITIN